MPQSLMHCRRLLFVAIVALSTLTFSQTASVRKPAGRTEVPEVKESDIRAEMDALASDAMRGRGSGTPDELRAGKYIASQLAKFGIQPAGDPVNGGKKGFIETVPVGKRESAAAPPLFAGKLKPALGGKTWNVIGVLPGSDPALSTQTILITAHMDHLGVDPKLKGDQIYNGADDDASGCIAVLELARALARSKPKRTIYFITFGSEEKGGYGAQYFLQHPPVPISNMTANLEFEMIGRPDPAVDSHSLWLTGYDRSNLGPELAKHGAHLVADPHPEQDFFKRSDNYALAKKGVVAQTVSSFGLHKDYHRPSDEISRIDFAHMTHAINSMVGPVMWLANSDFTPEWVEGKKP